ncbi:hypothetical protein GCM10023091_24990 [Ravibacter arvi]|uniref:TolC family protein n=1 Tax=Ravibacter arvi TaxID=2051041 RepID=A0ABP8M293_9BACT
MNIRFKFLSILLVFAVSARFSTAQVASSPQSVVLEDYIREGLSGNLGLRQQQLEVAKAVQTLREARALFYPQFSLAPTYSLAYGGRKLQFPVGDLLNPAYAALNQLTGSDRFPTDIPNVNEQLAPHNFHDTKVSFQYAVYNPEIRYNHLIQNSLLHAEEARLELVTSELVFAISEAYFRYLQTLQANEVLAVSHKTLAELLRLNNRLVANNVLTRDAVLSTEYEMAVLDQQRVEATRNTGIAKAYFNFLLNRDFGHEIVVDTLLTGNFSTAPGDLDLQNLVSQAVSGRSEVKQLDQTLLAAGYAQKLQEKSALLPQVFIGGNAGFQGFGYRFAGQQYLLTQAGLKWDLFKGFERRAKIEKARIQKDLLQIKQTETGRKIALEVTESYQNYQAAVQGMRVANAALEKARAYYAVVESRYRNQNVLMVELLKARNDWESAAIQKSLTVYQLLTRQAHLRRVTGDLSYRYP